MTRIARAIGSRWIPALMAVNLLIALIVNINLLNSIGRPFGGFLIEWTGQTSWYKVSNNTPYWMPGLLVSGLTGGDGLIALNRQPFSVDHAQRYADIFARGETTATLTVLRGESILDVVIPIRPFSLADAIDSHLPEFLNGLCYWLLALVVYRTRPGARLNQITAVAANMLGAAQWFRHYAPLSPTEPAYLLAETAWHVVVAFVGVTVIHFALLVTRDTNRAPRGARAPDTPRWLIAAYGVTTFAAIAYGLDKALVWPDVTGWTPLAGQAAAFILGTLFWIAYGIGMGVMIARALWVLFRTRSRRMRRQLIILLLGILVAFLAFMREGILPDSFFGPARYFTLSGLDMRLLQLGIPLGMAFMVVRYQTLRGASDLFIFVLLLAGSALVANIGAWLIRLSTPDPGAFSIPPFVPVFGVAFLFGALWAGQPFWRNVLSRLFRWESHSLQSIQRFSETLSTRGSTEDLPARVTAALVSEFSVEQAAVWLWEPGARCYHLAAQAGDVVKLGDIHPTPETTSGAPLQHPLLVGPDAPTAPAWLAALTECGFEAVAPLTAVVDGPQDAAGTLESTMRIGLLALGKRWDEETFHERDLEVFDLVAQQVALFIVTARQIDELRHVPERVNEAQERERAHLAEELHDTIQQFLGGLPLYLESVRRLASADPIQSDALLRDCMTDAHHASQTVRQIRQNLSPIQIQNSLSRPLGELVRYAASRYSLAIHLDCAPDIDTVLPGASRHAVYRTIQQALDNVGAHAHASRVDVLLRLEQGRLTFTVKDNGCGSSAIERASAANDGHFGLISMHSRIAALSGELTIASEPGAGTLVSAWLPI